MCEELVWQSLEEILLGLAVWSLLITILCLAYKAAEEDARRREAERAEREQRAAEREARRAHL